MSQSSPRPIESLAARISVAAFVFAATLLFAFATNHAWEDWYITYRASKNLAVGNGLVFSVGERVHSFTSPLGTLIPTLLNVVTGNVSDDLVLWLYRVVSAAALALACLAWLKVASWWKLSTLATILSIGLLSLDAKTVDFSINGMETGILVLALMLTVAALALPSPHMGIRLGLAWGLLMWTRPDGCVYAGAIALGWLLFVPSGPDHRTRMELLKKFAVAAAVAAAVYLPWVIFATSYYGSPIPHTIKAKGLLHHHSLPAVAWAFVKFPISLVLGGTSAGHTFMPPYAEFGGWPYAAFLVSKCAALVAAFYWCVPGGRPEARAVSLAAYLAHFYLSRVAAYVAPWYVPSVTVLSIIVLTQVFQHICDYFGAGSEGSPARYGGEASAGGDAKAGSRIHPVPVALAGMAIMYQLVMTVLVGYQMSHQQAIIESGNRKQIGLWLAEHAASPQDSVFLECLGYIGFYSNLKMLDMPGLSSPEVVAARKELNTNDYAAVIEKVKPTWLVLRGPEIEAISRSRPDLLAGDYEEAKIFNVGPVVEAIPFMPGRNYLRGDSFFSVFKRKK